MKCRSFFGLLVACTFVYTSLAKEPENRGLYARGSGGSKPSKTTFSDIFAIATTQPKKKKGGSNKQSQSTSKKAVVTNVPKDSTPDTETKPFTVELGDFEPPITFTVAAQESDFIVPKENKSPNTPIDGSSAQTSNENSDLTGKDFSEREEEASSTHNWPIPTYLATKGSSTIDGGKSEISETSANAIEKKYQEWKTFVETYDPSILPTEEQFEEIKPEDLKGYQQEEESTTTKTDTLKTNDGQSSILSYILSSVWGSSASPSPETASNTVQIGQIAVIAAQLAIQGTPATDSQSVQTESKDINTQDTTATNDPQTPSSSLLDYVNPFWLFSQSSTTPSTTTIAGSTQSAQTPTNATLQTTAKSDKPDVESNSTSTPVASQTHNDPQLDQ